MPNKLWFGHEHVLLKSMHKVYVRTVTLTFNLAIWFLFATHSLVMMIICAKLFLNPTMHNKVMVRARTGFTDHLCQIIFKSHYVWLSYGPDTILEHTHMDRVNSICPPPFHGGGIKRFEAYGCNSFQIIYNFHFCTCKSLCDQI